MTDNREFFIISVTGAHSGVGKTSLCALLLGHLHGFGAIKFTKTELYTSVTDDPEQIMQGDKDTAVMSRAGAKKVVWVQSPTDRLQEALDIALMKMTGLKGVVVEGNSPADIISPHLIVFVLGDQGEIKASAEEFRQKADSIVVNTFHCSLNQRQDNIKLNKEKVFFIDLLNKRGDIDKFLLSMEKSLAKKLN
jgi:molybdopterin-guanine dinucleotide biosynthesis protein